MDTGQSATDPARKDRGVRKLPSMQERRRKIKNSWALIKYQSGIGNRLNTPRVCWEGKCVMRLNTIRCSNSLRQYVWDVFCKHKTELSNLPQNARECDYHRSISLDANTWNSFIVLLSQMAHTIIYSMCNEFTENKF